VSEWAFAQKNPSEQLCKLHHFSIKKQQPGGDVEFTITVREFVTAPDACMKFLAQADKQTNQRTAPFTPSGWGNSLFSALEECIRAIQRFPYEGPDGVK
jgi:hypothetical protein